MNRFLILATAVLVVVAGMSVTQEANAGLFNRNKNKCCEAPKCCKPKKCRRQKRKAKKCCKQTCCAPAPTCCEAAPVCAAPAPAPCPCAAPAPCGCAAAPSCGCEAAPACGCETNCNCLSKRKLRRANRKGECCGAVANSCNTCDSAVQTVSYEVAAPAGCSSCGSAAPVAVEGCSSCSGEVVVESAPAEEAAPEAPESN